MARNGGNKVDHAAKKHTGLLKLVQMLSYLVVYVSCSILGLATGSLVNRYITLQGQLFFTDNNKSSTTSCHNCTILKPSDQGAVSSSMELSFRRKSLTHSMNDEQLFWTASLVPYKEEYPFDRVPKVAFMFLTRGPLPLLPLWERFFMGYEKLYSIYVHPHPKYKMKVSKDSPFYGRQIPSQEVKWGHMSAIDAEKRLLANALLDFSNEWFVLLSESCIPVYKFTKTYAYLIRSEYSFVESFDELSFDGRGRYFHQMLPEIQPHQWRKGSQWFAIQRDLAIYIVSETKYHSVFKKLCYEELFCLPEEHYIPTYLSMFHGSLIANRTLTLADWSVYSSHPTKYGRFNVTESLINSIRNNGTLCSYNSDMMNLCYLFARKFAPSALKPLLKIAAKIMQY
ncbi:unnamed protein product [Dovyalis caffra]|uniref:Uncharacterized protein n=1 Tax=Dovyalis caffra TaxID=77055 RepID=A0AAV1SX40_9ROSI|nr:unnamed protein product [Dovyalis caffra]